jgi:hypothetical protein
MKTTYETYYYKFHALSLNFIPFLGYFRGNSIVCNLSYCS